MKIGFVVEGSNIDVGDAHAIIALCKKVADEANVVRVPIVIAGQSKKTIREEAHKHVDSLRASGCSRIVFVWDNCPPWSGVDLNVEQFVWAASIWRQILRGQHATNEIHMVCARRELEAWLLTDDAAVKAVLEPLRGGAMPSIRGYNQPDTIPRPKVTLHNWWWSRCGRQPSGTEYGRIAAECRLAQLRRSASFQRFEERVTR
jgi:hypothetical protein